MRPTATAFAILAAAAAAQDPTHGNGIPSAYLHTGPAFVGGLSDTRFGSPTAPNGVAVVVVSGSFTPFVYPFAELGGGPIAMDPLDPAFQFFFFALDGAGNGTSIISTPPFFAPASPPLYVNAVVLESPTQWSVSKTARIDWMAPNVWESGPIGQPRQLHTATLLAASPRDNTSEVLLCGGATGSMIVPTPIASAELYAPLTRSTVALPAMSLPRAGHRAVRLANGLVLVMGGVTTGGLVTATCEFYAPASRVFFAAPSMLAPRAGHAVTMLDDGRVLVTGGVADWQNTSTNFVAALNTAQDTAEIFDPATSQWTPMPLMASKRLGHSQTKLADGRVLVVGGISGGYNGALGGGQVPQYTTTCEIFDPANNSFTATGQLMHNDGANGTFAGRAYHGAGLLPNGDVVITGGFLARHPVLNSVNDETIVVAYADRWNPTTGNWSAAANLLGPLAYHGMEPFGNGFLIAGGFSGSLAALETSAATGLYDGSASVLFGPIPGGSRGAHTLTRIGDGTYLVYGGGVWPGTRSDGWVIAPQ